MKLYIFRHGITDWNIKGKMQGQTDTELNETGIWMAKETAKALADVKYDYIFSSPLKRAYKTAAVLKGEQDTEIVTDERIKEISFGIYEGLTPDKRPGDFAYFFDAPTKYRAPEGGESFEELIGRARDFIENVIYPLAKEQPDANVLISGHGAVNRALMLVLKDLPLKDFWQGSVQKNCSLTVFHIDTSQMAHLLDDGMIFYHE